MRDLLFLSHRIPYPPDKGDKIRSYHIFRHLAARFRIHLGCFYDVASDARHVALLKDYCADVFCLPLTRPQKMMRAAMGMMVGKSFSETSYRDERMAQWVNGKLTGDRINDGYIFCSAMAPYVLAHTAGKRIVVDMVDMDSAKWGEYAQSMHWPARLLCQAEQRRLLSLERRAAAACDRTLFVSAAEAHEFQALAPESAGRVGCIENGVDSEYFNPTLNWADPFTGGPVRILFTGAMDYHPNVDAVTWFAGDIFPAIRASIPEAEFWIVGSNPAAKVRHLQRGSGVHVTGRVEDIRPYLAHASCVVAPLRIARGTQNKVLEAMAMAKTVVASGKACLGLQATPGHELLVADEPAEFARKVLEVLAGRWVHVARAARSLITSDYGWADKLATLDEFFCTHVPAADAIAPVRRAVACEPR